MKLPFPFKVKYVNQVLRPDMIIASNILLLVLKHCESAEGSIVFDLISAV